MANFVKTLLALKRQNAPEEFPAQYPKPRRDAPQ
jgi:hypothetical protein